MKPSRALPVIIGSQFACTSLWFAGNAVVDDLALKTGMGQEIVGYLISSVQLGFITGTLLFALLMVADRYSPSRVFMVCALLAALCNLTLLVDPISVTLLLGARFGTGFFLAGVYPVGMKIAADYYEKGLGKALGWLVGALVLGTALPYFISGTSWGRSYASVVLTTSCLSVLGGILLWFLVPDGPFRKPSIRLQLKAGAFLFKIQGFRKAAFGYFGHMWELYAFWAFTPFAVQTYNSFSETQFSVPIVTGSIIGLGAFSCVVGGMASQFWGSKKVATTALLVSGCFCLLSPLIFSLSPYLFLCAWGLWGMAVTADSPQFSNQVAAAVPSELKGTALTIVNCLGFAISIVSIQLLAVLVEIVEPRYLFLALSAGPVLGLISSIGKSAMSIR
ncbi:MAG: MFS transporter [Pricia sp.]